MNLACAVKRLVKEERFPHVLFYGPPGTGKTSTILAVARQMYGASMRSMVLELNASDDRGISIVREQVVDFASTRTMFRCALLLPDPRDPYANAASLDLIQKLEKQSGTIRERSMYLRAATNSSWSSWMSAMP